MLNSRRCCRKRRRKNGRREKRVRSKKCFTGVGSLSSKEVSLFTKMHQNTIQSGHNSEYRVSLRVQEKVRGNESGSIYILTRNPHSQSPMPLWLQGHRAIFHFYQLVHSLWLSESCVSGEWPYTRKTNSILGHSLLAGFPQT